MGMGIELDFTVDEKALARVEESMDKRGMRKFNKGMAKIVEDHGIMLYMQITKNASARPGPVIRTGRYVGSWFYTDPVTEGAKTSIMVYTYHPAAMRLEWGFVGTDSLGRNYAQPPYPHVRPAKLMVLPKLEAAVNEYIQGWMS